MEYPLTLIGGHPINRATTEVRARTRISVVLLFVIVNLEEMRRRRWLF